MESMDNLIEKVYHSQFFSFRKITDRVHEFSRTPMYFRKILHGKKKNQVIPLPYSAQIISSDCRGCME